MKFVQYKQKSPPFGRTFCVIMAGAQGIEPWTYGFGDSGSIMIFSLFFNGSTLL